MPKTKVALIGGGPVGLLGCLLLESFGVQYICFQKFEKLRSHPSAHWVSARSKQILSQVNGLTEKIDRQQQSFANFQYYRYCQKIGGVQMGKSNHFLPSIQERLLKSSQYFGQFPSHISQSKLLSLYYQHLKEKERVLFNQQIASIEKNGDQYEIRNSRQEIVGKSDYVVICNGIKSNLRDSLGIKLQGQHQIFKIINIHFRSKQLARIIKLKKQQAMLFFVYNSQALSIMVNHSLDEGQFVLQVPNYQPFIDLNQVYTPQELIHMAVESSDFKEMKKDIQVIHVGQWKLQALLADRMIHDKIFLAGDTAHTYTPAGGFGMNCGFQDMNQAIHTIHMLQKNPNCNSKAIMEMFNADRLNTNRKYLEKSLKNFKITSEIAGQFGFPEFLTQYYFNFGRMIPSFFKPPGMDYLQKIRLLTMKGLFRKKTIHPHLQLFFDEFDLNVQPLSQHQSSIINSMKKKEFYDLWVDEAVSEQQIRRVFGQIQEKNINRTQLSNGEKIVRRDGVIIL